MKKMRDASFHGSFHAPLPNVEYGTRSPITGESVHEILKAIENSTFQPKEMTFSLDPEKNSFEISYEGAILRNGGIRVFSDGLIYTSYKEEIVPEEKLKGKPPKTILLRFEEMKLESPAPKEILEYFQYELKSEDGKLHFTVFFQNFKTFGHFAIKIVAIDKIIKTSTGEYGKPCIEIVIDNYSNLSKIFTLAHEASAPPTNTFEPTSAPIILYNDSLETLAIAPLENPLLFWTFPDKKNPNKLHFGIEGLIEDIPANFTHEIIIFPSKGIAKTLEQLGDRYLAHYDKAERHTPYDSLSLGYLGYSTAKGAAYHEKTEQNLNYLQTFLLLHEEASLLEIPYGYYQVDDWFYPKRDGTIIWEANHEILPGGLTNLTEVLQHPLVCSNSWFSTYTIYKARHTGWIDQIQNSKRKELKRTFPTNPTVWEELMDNCKKCNCFVYEQDDLADQWDFFDYLKSKTNSGKEWLDWMADAADPRDIKIGYSKIYPNFLLASATLPNVTQVKIRNHSEITASNPDFIPHFTQSSMVAWAFGLWGCKDSFRSTNIDPKEKNENFGQLELLISVLSGGAVSPGDPVGYQDFDLLIQCCREDGLLLKPDRPLFPIEMMYLHHQKPYICSSYSKNGENAWIYILSTLISKEISKEIYYTLQDLGFDEGNYVYYDYFDKLVKKIDSFTKLGGHGQYNQLMNEGDFHYGIIAPIFPNGMSFIGFRDKLVSCPNIVFRQIEEQAGELLIIGSYSTNKEFSVILYSENEPKSVSLNGNPLPIQWGEHYKTLTVTLWLTDSEAFELRIK